MGSLLRRAEPLLVPLVVVVGLLQVGTTSDRWGVLGAVAWSVLLSLPLLARHRFPATAACLLAAATLAYAALSGSTAPFVGAVLAFLIGFYSAGAWATGAASWVALGFGLACFWTNDARQGNPIGEYVSSAVLVCGPWIAGRALRAVRRQNARLVDLAERLDAEREAHARDAVLAERARIAREMHDAVGHSLSVISLHTHAARAALDHESGGVEPARLIEPLSAIGLATGSAMVEMRRLVALLGTAEDEAAPTLQDLPVLVEEHRASGLDVQLVLASPAERLPLGVEMAAYRIVQEGLTNVRRHSGARRACVEVLFDGQETRLEVSDEGPPLSKDPVVAGGSGLAGARARAATFGGTVDAGPRGTGWTLRAMLPHDVAKTG